MKKLKMYIFFIVPVYVVLSFFWNSIVEGVLYYCSDSLPFMPIIPQFVHGAQYGDRFFASPVFTYFAWVIHMILLFVVPFKLVSLILKKK